MRSVVCVALSAVFVACASAPPAPVVETSPPAAAEAPETAQETPAAASSSAASPAFAAPATPAPSPPRAAPVLAADSSPQGISPLNEDEREEAKTKCKPLTDALAKAAKSGRGSMSASDYAEEALRNPPKVPGIDVPRCVSLMLRDLQTYRARAMELNAVIDLKRIAVGMSRALEDEPSRFCPSAAPVPPDLAKVATEPFASSPSDWSAPGWQCVGFGQDMPQRYQYELRTDPKTQTFEAIARGFPVAGQPVSELSLTLRVENGALMLSSDVMRR